MSPSAFPSPAAGGVLSGESLDAPVSVVTTLFRTGNFGASGLRTVVEGLVASGSDTLPGGLMLGCPAFPGLRISRPFTRRAVNSGTRCGLRAVFGGRVRNEVCSRVAPHPLQRTRRGRTSIVSTPRPRMRWRRPYPHRARAPPHPRRGQPIVPSVRACSADSAVRTMIIGRCSGHEAPAWSITSSPRKGPNRVGATRFRTGSAPAEPRGRPPSP